MQWRSTADAGTSESLRAATVGWEQKDKDCEAILQRRNNRGSSGPRDREFPRYTSSFVLQLQPSEERTWCQLLRGGIVSHGIKQVIIECYE